MCINKKSQYRRLWWLDHVGRMHERVPKCLWFSLVSGRRSVGRPLLIWIDSAHSDLTVVQENKWYSKCQDRIGRKIAVVRSLLAHV